MWIFEHKCLFVQKSRKHQILGYICTSNFQEGRWTASARFAPRAKVSPILGVKTGEAVDSRNLGFDQCPMSDR